jgi:hypothetical protein
LPQQNIAETRYYAPLVTTEGSSHQYEYSIYGNISVAKTETCSGIFKSDFIHYNYNKENKGSDKPLKKCLNKIHSEVPREERKETQNFYSSRCIITCRWTGNKNA